MAQKVKETRTPRAARRGGAAKQNVARPDAAGGKPGTGGKPATRVPGETTISSQNQVTIPVAVLRAAGFKAGDKVKIDVDGAGWIQIGPASETIDQLVDRISGSLSGVYGSNYLEQLRKEEW